MLSGQYKLDVEHAASSVSAHFAVAHTANLPRASSINIVFKLLCVSIYNVFALFPFDVSLLYPFLCSDRHVERNNWRDGGVRRARSLAWIYVLYRKKS